MLSTLGRLRDAGHHLQPNLERRADLIAATIAGRGEPPRLPGGSHPDDGSSPPEPSTTYDEEIALALAYMFPSPETRAEDSPIVVTEPEASTSATAGRTQRPGLIRAVSTEPAQPRTQATSAEPSPVEVRPMLADEGAATTVRRLTDPTEQRSSDEVIAVPGAASAPPQPHSSGSEIILPVHQTGSEADPFSASNLFLGGLGRLFDSRRGSLSAPDSPLASTQGAVEDPDPLRSSIGRRAGRRLRSDTVGSSQAWSLPSASPESPHTVPDPPVDDTPEAIRRRKGKGRATAETQVPLTPTAPSDDERFDRDTALAVNLSRAEQVEQRPGGPSGADRSMPAGSFPPPAPPAPPVPAASATASSLRRRNSVQIITPVPPRSEASTSEAPTLRRGRT
ncbi:MAG TPA: hypothetical protein VHA75_00935, partial [Rugosimonospora sp.]|nr:hypothetical protein [Rugosimonospora sp.]